MRSPQGAAMRRFIWTLLTVLGLATAHVPAAAQATDWSALIQAARPAVVWILAETATGTSAGSGAIISPDGYILTAAHVIEGATRIRVVVEDTYEHRASVVNADYGADIAVLKISATGLTWFALGDSDRVVIEEPIRVLGYPLPGGGVGFIAVAGIVQGTRVRDGVELLQHNASTAGGHSGGPVMNAHGQVIGVHSLRFVDQPDWRIAVAVNEAQRLIPGGILPTGPSPVRPAVAPAVAPVTVVRVPQDQATIPAALRAAAEGAEIQVARGTYRGDVSITKAVAITGEAGATIEGTVRVSGTRSVTISNLQIRGGVEIRDSTLFTLDRVTVAGSPTDGVRIEASTGVITGCTIEDATGHGIVASFASRVTVSATTVRRSGRTGIVLLLGPQAKIADSVIVENRGDGISIAGSVAHIQDTSVRGNVGCGIRADAGSTLSGSISSANTRDNQGGNLCGTALRLDSEPPAIVARIEPQPTVAGWNATDVRVVFVCADPLSGIASCPEPRTFVQEGVHEVTGEAADTVGNRARVTATVRLDRTPPTGSVTIAGGASTTTSSAVALRIPASDALSGVAEMRFSNDGRTWSPWETYAVTKARWDLTGHGGTATEGAKTVHVQVRDRAGNASSVFSSTVALLASPNPLPAPANLTVSPAGWTNAASFTVDWDDPAQIPPRAAAWYTIGAPPEHPRDGTRVTEKPIRVPAPADGEHLVYLWLEDGAGRADHTLASTVRLRSDRTPPELTAGSPQGTAGIEGWYRSDVTVSFSAADNLSGFAPDGRPRLEASRTSSGEGADILVQFSITDLAGNTATVTAGPFRVDRTPPTIAAQPSRPPDRDGWYNRDLTVSFACDDRLSGVASCPPVVTVSREGRDQVIQGEVVDRAGNRAAATTRISLDKTPPTGSLTINAGAATTDSPVVTLAVSGSDGLSGVDAMRFSNDGSTWSDWEPFTTPRSGWDLARFGGSGALGTKTVYGQVRDRAGNVSPSFTASIAYALPEPISLSGHAGSVSSVAFSPDGRTLASGSGWPDMTIWLWDVVTGRVVRTLSGHTDWISSVAFSPDGRTLASGSGDNTVRLWDVSRYTRR